MREREGEREGEREMGGLPAFADIGLHTMKMVTIFIHSDSKHVPSRVQQVRRHVTAG